MPTYGRFKTNTYKSSGFGYGQAYWNWDNEPELEKKTAPNEPTSTKSAADDVFRGGVGEG